MKKKLEQKKLPIKIANGTKVWIKETLPVDAYIAYIKLAFSKAIQGDNDSYYFLFSTTEHVDGDDIFPSTSGVREYTNKFMDLHTSGKAVFETSAELKLWNYFVEANEPFWLGMYQNSGNDDNNASIFIYYSKTRLSEVLA